MASFERRVERASERSAAYEGAALSSTVHSLRSATRRVTASQREARCGVSVVSMYPSIEIRTTSEGKVAKTLGIMKCGHIWTCPVCSLALRAERASRIRRAIEYSRKLPKGRRKVEWRMVTLTFRHRRADKLKTLLDGMMKAWRRTRQDGSMARLWGANVSASVRAIEVTWGRKHGWHAHLHVLLRTTLWSRDEKDALFERWSRFIGEELGASHRPTKAHGIAWSSHNGVADYVAKMGLELTGYGKAGREEGSVSPWTLAERAASLYDRRRVLSDDERRVALEAMALWEEFQAGTRGRRAIELDDRAQAMAEREALVSGNVQNAIVHPDGSVEYECPPLPPEPPPFVIDLTPEEVAAWAAGERALPAFSWLLLRALEASEDPVTTLREWLRWALHGRAPPRRMAA